MPIWSSSLRVLGQHPPSPILTSKLAVLLPGKRSQAHFPQTPDGVFLRRQSVATIDLTPDETDRYRKCPVILDFATGFYMFPVCKRFDLAWYRTKMLANLAQQREYHEDGHPCCGTHELCIQQYLEKYINSADNPLS